MEEWRPVENWEDVYEVSNQGRVRSISRDIEYSDGRIIHREGKVITPNKVNSGYYQITFYSHGGHERHYVHQLVAKTFIDNPNDYTEIHHKDHDKSNNCANNLEWVTHHQNIVESVKYHSPTHEYKDSHNVLGTHRCLDCGAPIRYKSVHCRTCAVKHVEYNYKSHKLTSDEVKNALVTNHGNFTQAAKAFGMTDNALRKWCKKYGLPTHSKDWRH